MSDRKITCPRRQLTREQREGRVWYYLLGKHNMRVIRSWTPPDPPIKDGDIVVIADGIYKGRYVMRPGTQE